MLLIKLDPYSLIVLPGFLKCQGDVAEGGPVVCLELGRGGYITNRDHPVFMVVNRRIRVERKNILSRRAGTTKAPAFAEAFMFNFEQITLFASLSFLLGSLIVLWRRYSYGISIPSKIPFFGFEFDCLILRLPMLISLQFIDVPDALGFTIDGKADR